MENNALLLRSGYILGTPRISVEALRKPQRHADDGHILSAYTVDIAGSQTGSTFPEVSNVSMNVESGEHE